MTVHAALITLCRPFVLRVIRHPFDNVVVNDFDCVQRFQTHLIFVEVAQIQFVRRVSVEHDDFDWCDVVLRFETVCDGI